MRFNKSRLLWGGLVFIVLTFVFSFIVKSNRTSLTQAQNTLPLTQESLSQLEEDQPVIIYGTIAAGPTFYQDIVMGVYERYYSGEDGGWEVEQDPEARLKIQLDKTPSENVALDVFYDSVYPHGNYVTITPSSNNRYKGYRIGDSLTTVAVVSSLNPLSFDATAHYGGTLAEYQRSLKDTIATGQWIAAVGLGICTLIMFWPERN